MFRKIPTPAPVEISFRFVTPMTMERDVRGEDERGRKAMDDDERSNADGRKRSNNNAAGKKEGQSE